jgi:hypothetical protein
LDQWALGARVLDRPDQGVPLAVYPPTESATTSALISIKPRPALGKIAFDAPLLDDVSPPTTVLPRRYGESCRQATGHGACRNDLWALTFL